MAGEATVGSIIAYMRIDRAEWARDRDAIKREASELDGKRIKITFTTNAAEAITAIRTVSAAQRSLDGQQGKLSSSAVSARRNVGLLSTAIIGLGPAAIPVGAVVGGALLGAVPAAGVLLLAVKGVQRELVTSTGQTKKYSGALQTLQTDLHGLEATAAAGVLRPFTGVVGMLHAQMPTLNREVAMFSTGLGQIAGNSAVGLLAMFHQLNPLFVTFDRQLITGSQRFKAWATSSDSLRHFIAYAQTQLPTVENAIGSLAVTIGHLIQAAAPFGSTTLQAITLFSRAINALPIGVLQTLVPLLAGLKLGSAASTGFSNAAVGLGEMAARAKAAGGIASGAAGTVGMLGKAVGFLGPVGLAAGLGLGALSIVMTHHQQAAAATTSRVNALTQALQNQQTVLGLLAELQATGATAAADKLGISQDTLLGALQSKSSAVAAYNKQVTDMYTRYQAAGTELAKFGNIQDRVNNEAGYNQAKANYDKLGGALVSLSAAMQKSEAEYAKAKTALADYAASQGDAVLAAQVQSGAVDKLARSYGVSADAYYNAKLAADKKTQSDQAQTVAMQLENDAAGLLGQAFDKLNGKTLNISDANVQLHQASQQLDASLKSNGRSFDLNTQAGLANQQALNAQIHAIEGRAQAISGGTELTKAGTEAYRADMIALRDHIKQVSGNSAAVQQLDQMIRLLPPVATTTTDVQTAQALAKLALLRSTIVRIPNKSFSVFADVAGAIERINYVVNYARNQVAVVHVVTQTSTGVFGGQQAGEKVPRHADGGVVGGSGGPRSDNQLILASPGERIVPNGPSQRYAPFLDAIIAGRGLQAFATGGTVGRSHTAKAKQVIVPLTVTAGGGQAYGIASYIKGQIPSATAATRLLSAAVNDAFRLNGVMSKLAAVKTDLTNTQQAALQFRNTVITGRLGTVDPNAYGSAGDLSAAYTSGSADNARYQAEFAKLKREGLTASLLAQFTGPSAGLDALASASGTEIGQLNKSYAGFVGSTGAAGSAAANSLYGGRMAQDQRAVSQLSAEVVKDRAALLAVGRALVEYTHRPLTVAIGNKEFLKTIEASGALQSLVDDLKRRLRL